MDPDSTKLAGFEIEKSLVPNKNRRVISQRLTRVFSEDYRKVKGRVFDPRGERVRQWNKYFLVASLISIAIDPLFFYLPLVNQEEMCMGEDTSLKITLTVIRSIVDVFYIIQIYVRFRTAYDVPSTRLLGRGELVLDPFKISQRYLKRDFSLDLLASLPIPQVLTWLPIFDKSEMLSTKISILYFIMFQFFLRLYLIFKLTSHLTQVVGVVAESTLAGAAYNIVLFLLAAHVFGACYYLLSIERQGLCWKEVCDSEEPGCGEKFFNCRYLDDPGRASWYQTSNITDACGPETESYEYGMIFDAVDYGVASLDFFTKYSYCLWWGLRAIGFAAPELRNFKQTYLESRSQRLEEYRIQQMDTEGWMNHRQLPEAMRERVRKHDLYKWIKQGKVEEKAILDALPMDIHRDIKHHICIELVRRVPLFDQMDERTIDAICERLRPVICTPGTCLLREGDPTNEMLFIMHGHLDSYTTDGGRAGFWNQCEIGPGDFCGEELLTWALDPQSYNRENVSEQSKNKARIRETGISLGTNVRRCEILDFDDSIRTPVPKPNDPEYFDSE
ncbi:Cyclic nucleotide-binding domain-containing protein [Cynara cardunculus var. scolymus]|uniref:Cyclic nucleotide-binding domain-containing protein n=1 Tax=Cynara cardunculus var. scolymus TaxID=59895 RepID=A0A103XNC9_CYNCS|nr:Cyclic nucleotide-binding domain-containing protein [Cynara cardunculus var. scolymus]